MQFTTLFTAVFLFAGSAFATNARYATYYGSADASMNNVACSNGDNGLAARFPTLGDVPTFPNVGGAVAVTGWNSPKCGSCWNLTYAPEHKSILVTAVDYAGDGFVLSQQALDTLTDGQAYELGVVDVTAVEVPRSACGL